MPVANAPFLIGSIFHWKHLAILEIMSAEEREEHKATSTYQHETLYAFCNILGKFGDGYGARRTTKILCWDLSAPLSITRPLKKERKQDVRQ